MAGLTPKSATSNSAGAHAGEQSETRLHTSRMGDMAGTLCAPQAPGSAGGCIVLGMLVLALFAPWLAPYSPETFIEGGSARLQPPSWRFPMGTDNLGRDILSRVIHGARLSMLVGFVSTFLARELAPCWRW